MLPRRGPVPTFLILLTAVSPSIAGEPLEGRRNQGTAPRGALAFDRLRAARFSFAGHLGERVERNIDHWILTAPVANPGIVQMFRQRDRQPPPAIVPWAGEFVGKYLISAVQALRMTERPEVKRFVAGVVRDLLSTQADDGYLGPFPRAERLLGHWDLWGHYHVILALLMWHERTGDAAALDAAIRAGDLICRTYLEAGRRIHEAGSPEMNMAVIHALGKLHRITGKQVYLRQMRAIEEDWKRAGDYFRQGLAGIDFHRTPRPRWESLHDIQGLVELYRITGDARYRQAFTNLWWSIAERDRHNTGGFSSAERAIGHPYSPAAIETCCTVAWMALTVDMLRLTGDPRAGDELELSTWNGAAGAQHPSGRWWTYNTPMDGRREASAHTIVFQSRAGTPELNCCSVNAPRSLGMLSEWAVMRAPDGVAVNHYGPCRVSCSLPDGTQLTLDQTDPRTTYPFGEATVIRVEPSSPRELSIHLRVPGWSRQTEVRLNGSRIKGAPPGRYLVIDRTWVAGDEISLRFDLRLRTWVGDQDAAGRISIFRGPILLAYDRRWNPFEEADIPAIDARRVEGARVTPGPPEGGPDLASEILSPWLLIDLEGADGRRVRLCDFATAGCLGTRYRSWLPAVHAPPPCVLLDQPRRGQSLGPGRVLFRWTGLRSGDGTPSFVLEVSPREDFSELALREESNRPVVVPTFEFDAGRRYFWKVTAKNGEGEAESEARGFRIESEGESLTDREIEAMIPAPDGLLLAAALSGDPKPSRGILEDSRAIQPAAGPRGEANGAVSTDGKTGRIRYEVPLFPAEAYTASVWVRLGALPEGRLGQIASAWAGGMDDPLRVCIEDGHIFARIEAGAAFSTKGVPIETDRWLHVAVVKKGEELLLYLDGERRAATPVPAILATAARNIALGANPNFSGNEYLEASFADFRLSARALSDDDLASAARR